jgi:hypothetical protein
LHHQALELAVVVALHPVRAQLLQALAVVGFGGDGAAGGAAAEHGLPGGFVAAQEGGGGRVGDAQALEQGLGRVGRARGLAAVQGEAETVELLELGGHGVGADGLGHQAQRVGGGGVGAQRGDGEGAAGGQQERGQGRHDAPGMAMDEVGHRQTRGDQFLLHAQHMVREWGCQNPAGLLAVTLMT